MKWSNGTKCSVCLTFDVDGPLVWRSKKKTDPRFASDSCVALGEFGPTVGVPRILNLLKKYDIKGCFFIPGGIVEEYPNVAKQIFDEGHEIGFHSYAHVNPTSQTHEQLKEDFEKGLELFQRHFKITPTGYRSPAAVMDGKTWTLLGEYGFTYDSSMMGKDSPYIKTVLKKDIVEIPIHWMLDDWVHFAWNLYPNLPYQGNLQSPKTVYEIWEAEFDGMYELDEGCVYTLCMHPQIIGRASRIKMLERLIQHIRRFTESKIAKPIEIATEARHILKSNTAEQDISA